MAAVDPSGSQKYWIEGEPFDGLGPNMSVVGAHKFWFEGQPEENMTPTIVVTASVDKGKFFAFFD